jgi:hypothetical protein
MSSQFWFYVLTVQFKFNSEFIHYYQSCVQSKQPRKPHKAAEERHLAPLELIHYDICEMNGMLKESGQRYFMIMIDDASIYCYVYLLKTKDEVLNCLKPIRVKLKIN